MKKGLLLVGVVAAIVFAAPSTAGAATGAKLGVNFDCFGIGSYNAPSLYYDMQQAHSGWVRIPVSWADLEPRDPAVVGYWNSFLPSGTYPANWPSPYWSQLVQCLTWAHTYGQYVEVVVDAAPSWAGTGSNNVSPSRFADFAHAMSTLLADYPASDTTHGIDALEVWNEADTTAFWSGTEAQYITMLEDTYNAVQSWSTAAIVTAGTAHIDEGWLKGLFSGGAGPYFDVLGIHPYPHDHMKTDVANILNGNPPDTLNQVKSDMSSYGYGSRAIWLTEEGWDSNLIGTSAQATALTDFYNYIRGGCSACSNVKLGMWFTAWVGSGTYPNCLVNEFSLFGGCGPGTLSFKPAYYAYKNLP
jgi:hypothetical protein